MGITIDKQKPWLGATGSSSSWRDLAGSRGDYVWRQPGDDVDAGAPGGVYSLVEYISHVESETLQALDEPFSHEMETEKHLQSPFRRVQKSRVI
jgi:hypothetical protein